MTSKMDEWVRGFVLKTQDLGEADVLVTWFTWELGKIRGVVIGGRKITSRLLAGLSSGVVTELRLVARDGHGLYRLAGVRSVESSLEIVDSRGVLLQWFLEVVLRAVPDMQKNETLFVVAEDYFAQLRQIPNQNSWSQLLSLVLIKVLEALGITVHTVSDNIPMYVSVSRGGFFNTNEQLDSQPVEAQFYLRYMSLKGKSLKDRKYLPIDQKRDKQLFLWLHNFLEYHIDRKIRSLEFVSGILNQ